MLPVPAKPPTLNLLPAAKLAAESADKATAAANLFPCTRITPPFEPQTATEPRPASKTSAYQPNVSWIASGKCRSGLEMERSILRTSARRTPEDFKTAPRFVRPSFSKLEPYAIDANQLREITIVSGTVGYEYITK